MSDIAASEDFVDRYLARIAWNEGAPRVLDRATLERLARAHIATIPFENLRLHPDGVIVLDEDVIIRRILDDADGGLCYELNAAFAHLLRRLGAEVEYIGATVEIPDDVDPRPGYPLSHLALRVRTETGVHHVDVGFGGLSIVRDVTADAERVVAGDGRSYVVDATARPLSDFAAAAHWHSSSPDSRFQRSIVCSLVDDGIASTLFAVRDADGATRWGFAQAGERRDLSADEAARMLRERFGIRRALPRGVKAPASA